MRSAPDLDGEIDNTDLVLWYELDELDELDGKSVLDISGHEHHGTCRTTCPAIVDGYVEEALDFSGSTVIDVPPLEALETFTLTGWIWLPDATTALQCMVRERPGLGLPAWRICASPAEVRFITGTHALQIGTPIPTSTWVHVAVSWNALDKAVYVNGRLRGSVAAAGTTIANRLAIGAFLGHVDDLRIYRRALGAAEIDALYTELL